MRPRRQNTFDRLLAGAQLTLGHVVTRLILSAAIIISLLPFEFLQGHDLFFLFIFVPEFIVRLLVAIRRDLRPRTKVESADLDDSKWALPRTQDVLWLCADLIAIFSFLPVPSALSTLGPARWLRLFRLVRMVMLLRYWSSLAEDLWLVMLRRERARQVILMGLIVLVLSFAGAVILDHGTHRLQVDFDGDEVIGSDNDAAFLVRLWWAFRQIQDPGNMISGPDEMLVLAVSLALTVFGLFLVSFLIGLGTDVVAELMSLSRLRPPGLSGHTVVVNIGPSTRQLFYELARHYGKLVSEGSTWFAAFQAREILATFRRRRRRRFVIAGRSAEPPDFLRDREFANIIYRQVERSAGDEVFLDKADVLSAGRVVLLADMDSSEPDNETIRTVLTIAQQMIKRAPPDEQQLRPRKLIAEILDESNLFAAQEAIASIDPNGVVQPYIVPTERLLALFVACLARRPGVTELLLNLLRSNDHELYTYDYDYWRTSDAERRQRPEMPKEPAHAFARLAACRNAHPELGTVVPVGVLLDRDDRAAPEVAINPQPGRERTAGFRGFVVVAPSFGIVERFERALARGDGDEGTTETPAACPRLRPADTTPLDKVLICGFRLATVNVVEALLAANPECEMMIMVDDEAARALVYDTFHAHTRLVETGLLEDRQGIFLRDGDTLRYRAATSDAVVGDIQVAVGDLTSSRRLLELPRNFGAAFEMNLVILISGDRDDADARTTTALMKLEALFTKNPVEVPGQRVVAEVLEEELADSLSQRYEDTDKNVRVISIQKLRALLMFQSVVVPYFDLVYGELMAPWDYSFVHLEVAEPKSGRCHYDQLAAEQRRQGRILVALLLEEQDGSVTLSIAGSGLAGREFELSNLKGAWVIADEQVDAGAEAGPASAGHEETT